MLLGVIQCHWNYFITLHCKAVWFVKVVEETVRTDVCLWNGYLCELNHMALTPGSIKSSIALLGFLSPLNVFPIPSKKNLTRVSRILQEYACKTCTFMQEKDIYLAVCRILQESCIYICARFLQDPGGFLQGPARCKKNGPFLARIYKSCKILLQDRFYWE